jgi:hypothetical protein
VVVVGEVDDELLEGRPGRLLLGARGGQAALGLGALVAWRRGAEGRGEQRGGQQRDDPPPARRESRSGDGPHRS